MFIDDENNNQEISPELEQNNKQNGGQGIVQFFLANRKYLIYILPAILILIVFLALFLIINRSGKPTDIRPADIKDGQTKENKEYLSESAKQGIPKLPESESRDSAVNLLKNNAQAEHLTFGRFYKKDAIDFEADFAKFDLPINIKTDAANYHYINRKFNLDKYIGNLNKNGFVIIDNPYKNNADDFYGMYGFLEREGFPVLLTGDFTIYFFQNIVKQIYKDIEKDFFYDIFFETNKKLFDIANDRYRARMMKLGIANDPVLEGERMEAVFWAVALELLKPDKNQISSLRESSKFSTEDAEEFHFAVPAYLSEQVNKEIALIMAANKKIKSPTTLNIMDYKKFKVPADYQSSAKLKNFYLALKWMDTVFPLYYQGADCESCFIDKDDWVINFIAAGFLAKDLSISQDIKNHWAKIYKIISYFSGLRSELTYLYYDKAFTGLFGKEYDIEEIFSSDNPERDDNILKARDELSKYAFLDIEGGYDRSDAAVKPILGLRILTESYWPDNYIFSRLISPFVGNYKGSGINELNITYCEEDKAVFRCRGFGPDIVNLVYSIRNKDDFYMENINYEGYGEQMGKLKDKLANFNVNSWNNNNFWSTLGIIKAMLNTSIGKPSFAQSGEWEKKEINTALGAWINFQLPADEFILSHKKSNPDSGFGATPECNKYNYVEPNLELIKELKANSRMLSDMLEALGISGEMTLIKNKFENINSHLSGVERIIIKELSGESLNDEDCLFISGVIRQYSVKDDGKNSVKIKFGDTGRYAMKSIDGVKLMMAVNKYGEEKTILFAPIFNYAE